MRPLTVRKRSPRFRPASDAGLSGNTSETRISTPSNGVVIPSPTNWLAE